MSKELEALNSIKKIITNVYGIDPSLIRQQVNIIEQALKRNEPMKRFEHKIKDRAYPESLCPICFLQNHPLNHYCPYCGQRLDWSDEE